MALAISTNLSFPKDGFSLNFYETTGVYDFDNNPTGYGSPNPVVGFFTVVSLLITLPNETDPVTVNTGLLTNFPTDDPTISSSLTNIDLGLGGDDVLPDGIYKVNYTVLYTNVITRVYTVEQYFMNLRGVACCIDRKLLDIKTADCDCNDQNIEKLLIAYIMMETAIYLADCGDVEGSNDRLEFLQDFCAFNECKDC